MAFRSPGLAVALLAFGAVASCSSGDDAADPVATTGPAGATVPAVLTTDGPSSTAAATRAAGPTTATDEPTTAAAAPATTLPPSTVPVETGVPGLDSADAFCAAWSRFGGTWQVALAAGAFGGPAESTRLEVIAAPVVGEAYTAILVVWPDELAAERDVVADAYFGAFQRRSTDASAALERAGATPAQLAVLADVWVDALAGRDPSNPVIEVALPSELEALVEAAADDFASQRTALVEDPSMVITAATPLTDEYLATACPDQGAITGSDVVDG